ncbi:hypothetical protein SMICM304S_12141 [Streptomyces microflavus]
MPMVPAATPSASAGAPDADPSASASGGREGSCAHTGSGQPEQVGQVCGANDLSWSTV